jgi:hypothetical protein
MPTFIKLTHILDGKRKPIYVNVDQICRVGDSVGGGKGYAANILLANNQVDVIESVDEVMAMLIEQPSA